MKKRLSISVLLCTLWTASAAWVTPATALANGGPTIISGHRDEIFFITEPGNYIVDGETGPIWVDASDVNLDLNGGIVHQDVVAANVAIVVDRNRSNVHISGPGTVQCETLKSSGILLHLNTSKNHINGVTVRDCGFWGILLQDSSWNKINGNIISSGAIGIELHESNHNSVVGNIVTDSGIGIHVESSNENAFRGNITNNLRFYGISVDTRFGPSINNRFRGNTALNNGVVDLQDLNGNCDANSWRGNTFNTADPDCLK